MEVVAVANGYGKAAKLFSKDGSVIKSTLRGPFNASLWYIAVTSENKYILPGDKELLFYDGKGNKLTQLKAATYDMNNKLSEIKSLAVDASDRIIVGLAGNTISIHQEDGQFISKISTHASPNYTGLDVTSNRNIVATFTDNTLQVVDYSGNNGKVIQPPLWSQ